LPAALTAVSFFRLFVFSLKLFKGNPERGIRKKKTQPGFRFPACPESGKLQAGDPLSAHKAQRKQRPQMKRFGGSPHILKEKKTAAEIRQIPAGISAGILESRKAAAYSNA
jgi:hypothetical protein